MNALISKCHGILGALCLCLLIGPVASAQNAQERRRVINVRHGWTAVCGCQQFLRIAYVTVRLAPGTYLLSTYTRTMCFVAIGARCECRPACHSSGSEKRVDRGDGVPDPVSDETPDDFAVPGTETIIDGSALDLPSEERADCAGETFVAPNPVIHVGVDNLISRLTLFAGGNVGDLGADEQSGRSERQYVDDGHKHGPAELAACHGVLELRMRGAQRAFGLDLLAQCRARGQFYRCPHPEFPDGRCQQ